MTMLLTRRQYDYLVKNCPNWMELRWGEYSRQWFIGGVQVSGTPAQMENLKAQLPDE